MKVKRVSSEDLSRREFFRQYFDPGRPVVVEGEAEEARATKRWSPDYLKSALGDRPVQLAYQEQGLFDKNGFWVDSDPEREEVGFAEACRRIQSDGRHYVLAQAFDADRVRKAISDFGLDPQLTEELAGARRLLPNYGFWIAFMWFGGNQCKTPLHHDHSPNIFVQVRGKKRFILHPRYDQEYLYQCTEEDENFYDSRVNVFDPDLTEFPRYDEVEPWEATVEAGDVFFLPSGWWHAVESLTTSISVNHWWLDPTKVVQSAVQMLAPEGWVDSRSNCWMCAKQQT